MPGLQPPLPRTGVFVLTTSNPTVSPVDPASRTNHKAFLPCRLPCTPRLGPLSSGTHTVGATTPLAGLPASAQTPCNSSPARHQSTVLKAKNRPRHSCSEPSSSCCDLDEIRVPRSGRRGPCDGSPRPLSGCCRHGGPSDLFTCESSGLAATPHGLAGPCSAFGPVKGGLPASLPPRQGSASWEPSAVSPAGPHCSAS